MKSLRRELATSGCGADDFAAVAVVIVISVGVVGVVVVVATAAVPVASLSEQAVHSRDRLDFGSIRINARGRSGG
jgi:hypothetical protein